jgi:hypothetical protein
MAAARPLLVLAALAALTAAACTKGRKDPDPPPPPPPVAIQPPVRPPVAGPWFRPRSAWTQAPIDVGNTKPLGRPWRITVHHSGQAADAQRPGRDMLPLIEKAHRISRWACIGYHFVIDGDGVIWEGRPIAFQGAHAGDDERNRGNVGICLLGDFTSRPPSAAQLASLQVALAKVRERFRIPRSEVRGHLEVKSSTECPGRRLLDQVVAYRRAPGP